MMKKNFSIDFDYRRLPEQPYKQAVGQSKIVGGFLLGRFMVTDNTIVFAVDPNSNDEDNYMVFDGRYLSNDTTYNIILYDVGNDYKAPVAVVEYDSTKQRKVFLKSFNTSSVALVDKVVKAIDDDGDNVTKVYFIKDGKENESVIAKDDNVDNWLNIADYDPDNLPLDPKMHRITTWGTPITRVGELKPGDVIQFGVDSTGRMSHFRLLFTEELINGMFFEYTIKDEVLGIGQRFYGGNDPTGYREDILQKALYTAYGRVKALSANTAQFNAYDDSSAEGAYQIRNDLNRTIVLNGVKFYKYNNKSKKVSITSDSDLEVGQRIFVRAAHQNVKEIVIIED